MCSVEVALLSMWLFYHGVLLCVSFHFASVLIRFLVHHTLKKVATSSKQARITDPRLDPNNLPAPCSPFLSPYNVHKSQKWVTN